MTQESAELKRRWINGEITEEEIEWCKKCEGWGFIGTHRNPYSGPTCPCCDGAGFKLKPNSPSHD